MKNNARDLIYLDTNRYISLNKLRTFYWAIITIPFIMMVWGIALINMIGPTWKSLFPLVSIAIWSLLYWIFVLTIQSKKTKKTFQLRFLVNGISGLFISFLFWILYTSFNLVADEPIVGFDFSLWILFFYLLFSALYIGLIIFGVHKGSFKKIRKAGNSSKVIALDAFFASLIPLFGVAGMITSRLLRAHTSVSVQNTVATVGFVFLIFAPALAHMNFVQYYYCKKYSIFCDEYGDTTSPKLEHRIKKEKAKNKSRDTNSSSTVITKKRLPLIVKILIGIAAVPIVFFVVVCLVSFIKGFIKGIS